MKTQLLLICSIIAIAWSCSTAGKVEEAIPNTSEDLGKKLFFDPILSSDNSISCASCHKPEFAFADNVAFSKGVNNQLTKRNTPSAMNLTNRNFYFHDGRAESLEEQAKGPIENPGEMNLPLATAVQKLNNNAFYVQAFEKVFKCKPNADSMLKAISNYERTLETTSSFDMYQNENPNAVSESAKRGHKLFIQKAKCFDCHFGPDFTTDMFRNIGIFNGKDLNDSGRYNVTKKPEDIGRFKTPGLRNVALTAPYMHNGQFKTLKEVINYYNEPDKVIPNSINRDTSMRKPLYLTEQEKVDLEEFLKTLSKPN